MIIQRLECFLKRASVSTEALLVLILGVIITMTGCQSKPSSTNGLLVPLSVHWVLNPSTLKEAKVPLIGKSSRFEVLSFLNTQSVAFGPPKEIEARNFRFGGKYPEIFSLGPNGTVAFVFGTSGTFKDRLVCFASTLTLPSDEFSSKKDDSSTLNKLKTIYGTPTTQRASFVDESGKVCELLEYEYCWETPSEKVIYGLIPGKSFSSCIEIWDKRCFASLVDTNKKLQRYNVQD